MDPPKPRRKHPSRLIREQRRTCHNGELRQNEVLTPCGRRKCAVGDVLERRGTAVSNAYESGGRPRTLGPDCSEICVWSEGAL